MGIGKIIDGHIKEVLGVNQTLAEKRLQICEVCPLYEKVKFIGGVCTPYLFLNPETNELSTKFKKGFFKGCGCRLEAKTRLKHEECPVGKWKKQK